MVNTARSVVMVVVMALALALVGPATGTTSALDQSFTTPYNLGANINEGCKYIGQTFTAGVTGKLTGVNINVHRFGSDTAPALRVVIQNAVNGEPSGDPLGVVYLSDGQAPLSRLITFPHWIRVIAGQQYAIVVNYDGSEPGYGQALGIWDGGTGNGYAGGSLISGECPSYGTTHFWYVWGSYDVHFRTYVKRTGPPLG